MLLPLGYPAMPFELSSDANNDLTCCPHSRRPPNSTRRNIFARCPAQWFQTPLSGPENPIPMDSMNGRRWTSGHHWNLPTFRQNGIQRLIAHVVGPKKVRIGALFVPFRGCSSD
jgi:hypothetical protein